MKIFKKIINFALFYCLFLNASGLMAKDFDDKNYIFKLQIINEQKKTWNFITKIAKTNKEKERGLMFVKNLPQNYGMLFKFDKTKIISMWMKNTEISLDIIFIDEAGRIVDIKNQAKPYSLEIISSQFPALMVLEINGGLAEKLKIKAGNKVIVENLVY